MARTTDGDTAGPPRTRRWPVGGGAMGALVRAHDWATTPLGPRAVWPQRLRAAVDTVLSCAFPMIVLWGPDLIQVYNDGYRALMGVKHPAGLGQATRNCWPEVWPINAPIYARVWAGETLTFEDALYPITRSGALEDAWFTLCYSPLHDEVGAVAGILVTVFETTERHRAELAPAEHEAALRESAERQAYVLRLSDALRPLADPAEIQRTACRVLGEHTGVNRVLYGDVIDEREVVISHTYVAGVPPLVGRVNAAAFGRDLIAAYKRQETVIVGDVWTDPRFTEEDRRTYAAIDVAAQASLGLVKAGRWVAAVGMQHATPRAWTSLEISLLEETAERTWAAVERARAEAALRASEARLRRALEIETVGVIFFRATGEITAANEAFLRMSGYTAEDQAQGRVRWDALTPPEYLPQSLQAVQEFLTTGRTTPYEKEYLRKDGSRWWALFAATRIDAQTGVEFIVDITAYKQVEAALRESEERFRSFAESSADTLWIVDAATRRLEYLSPAFERMWGAPRAPLLRDLGAWATLIHPEDRARAEQVLPRALAGEAGVVDYRIVRPSDGAVRWIRDTGFLIRYAEGQVRRIGGIAQDVTDQQEAEAALRDARDALARHVAELETVLETIVHPLVVYDEQGRVVRSNSALRHLFGLDLTSEPLAGSAAVRTQVMQPLTPGGQPLPRELWPAPRVMSGETLRGPSAVEIRYELNGRRTDIVATGAPIRDGAGRIIGGVTVLHDVTEQVRLQDEFLALASHELRTPLTPTMGYLEMVPPALAAGEPERAARYVARALEQVGRLDALVSDLLDVGRLRGGKMALSRASVDLEAVVRRAVEAVQVAAGTQGQTITLAVPAEHAEPLRVAGDAGRLEQVVLNLLTNAVTYAAQSPTIAVRLWRDTEEGAAVLEVADAGPGIAAADLPHLFSRFYQVARPDRPARGGLGLGLYLVKELVDLHGGTIAVASEVGAGTTFTVRLPVLGAGAPARRRGEAGEGADDG